MAVWPVVRDFCSASFCSLHSAALGIKGTKTELYRLIEYMTRNAFVMSLNAGSEEEYQRRHTPIWPELEDVLKSHGARNSSIFPHPETRQLCLVKASNKTDGLVDDSGWQDRC